MEVRAREVEPNRSWIFGDEDGDWWWFSEEDSRWGYVHEDRHIGLKDRMMGPYFWSEVAEDFGNDFKLTYEGQFIDGKIHWNSEPIQRGETITHATGLHDSGTRQQFEGGGVRDTAEGKPRFDLLWAEGVPYDAQFQTRMAQIWRMGAEKYAARNWELFHTPDALEHAKASLGRHYANYMAGATDEDHLALMGCNLLMLATLEWKIKNGWKPKEGEGANG